MRQNDKLDYVEYPTRDLAATQARVEAAGGEIVKPIFEFPGGRRFHFTEPSGNELAVWSDHWSAERAR